MGDVSIGVNSHSGLFSTPTDWAGEPSRELLVVVVVSIDPVT